MNIVKPNAVLMEHNVHPYKFIEKVGRTCYKSEDKITDESAEKFVASLVKRQHGAMLEHEWLYLAYSDKRKNLASDIFNLLTQIDKDYSKIQEKLLPYFYFGFIGDSVSGITNYVAASFRTWIQFASLAYDLSYGSTSIIGLIWTLNNAYPIAFKPASYYVASNQTEFLRGLERDFEKKAPYIIIPREEIEKSLANETEPTDKLIHTMLFTCDRGVSHEFVRHRPASFGQESTRYCNYTKGQFGGEITVVEPPFWNRSSEAYKIWKNACKGSEKAYFELIKEGATPQEARSVLPNSLKTEIFITATEAEWQHIVNLRYHGLTGAPHPQMKEVMEIAYSSLVKASNGRIK